MRIKKNLLLVCFIVIVTIFVLSQVKKGFFALAVDDKVVTTTTEEKEVNEIRSFKEKIASKVTELQKKDQKPIVGKVIEVKNDQLKIITSDREEYQVKKDEVLTKTYQISGNREKEIDFSKIEKNDYIIIVGPILEKTITANFIYIDEKIIIGSGRVIEINKSDYSLKVLTSEKEEIVLDIETSTKQLLLNIKSLVLETSGFSKIKDGDTIHFVFKDNFNNKEKRYSARKILIIPQEYFIK
ncbi:MAG: hypothetical protein N2482_03050 [Patescibacteria group bacterium]|nr:hypothetical protein [Patescibacteria group bacterium]